VECQLVWTKRGTRTCTHLDIVVVAVSGIAADGEGGEVELERASVTTDDRPRTVGVVGVVVGIVGTSNDAARRVEVRAADWQHKRSFYAIRESAPVINSRQLGRINLHGDS